MQGRLYLLTAVLTRGLERAPGQTVLVLCAGYKSVAHYLVLTKLAAAAEEGEAAADANAAVAQAEDAAPEELTSTAPVTRQRKSSPARPGPLAISCDSILTQRLLPPRMHASLHASPDVLALYAELPAAAAAPVTDAQPVQPPEEEGNAPADVLAKRGNKGPAKRGRTKEAASPGVPVRQEKIDTILSKAKNATGTAKSLAGKALTKMAALAGAPGKHSSHFCKGCIVQG